MISGISSALSGLLGFQKKATADANNIANVETDGYKETQVRLEDNSAGGVTARAEKVNTPGPLVEEQTSKGIEPVELSNVNLNQAIPDTLMNQRYYEANLKSLKVADEMLGSLLDIKE